MGSDAPAQMACSCGFLPCICTLEVMEEVQVHETPTASHSPASSAGLARQSDTASSKLRHLLLQNAMKPCSLCLLIPCICPKENELGQEETCEPVALAAPQPLEQQQQQLQESDVEEVEMDKFGRVPLRKQRRCIDLNGSLTETEQLPERFQDKENTDFQSNLKHQHEEEDQDFAMWIPREIKSKLKAHQVDGVEFMYCHVQANRGCILADYMGLGKTLQVVTVVYSFLIDQLLKNNDQPKQSKPPTALVLSPAICIPNWINEFRKWLSQDSLQNCKLFTVDATKSALNGRARVFREWKEQGGVLLLGYEMFRSLLNPNATMSLDHDALPIQVCTRLSTSTMQITNTVAAKATKATQEFIRLLCDPGADLVVLDEGHRMKDPASLLCQSISRIATKRRLVLTGYPVQNSLSEYWCMVNFARESFLGSYDQFRSVFERPIIEGNAAKSEQLIDKLKPVVLRRGRKLLNKQLPPKHEWIVYCKLSKLQHDLYCAFLHSIDEELDAIEYLDDHEDAPMVVANKTDARTQLDLLSAYAVLLQVMNHPDIIHQRLVEEEGLDEDAQMVQPAWFDANSMDWGYVPPEKEVEKINSAMVAQRKKLEKQQEQAKALAWAKKYLKHLQETQWKRQYSPLITENSGKMVLLMELLQQSLACGDKVVVFSQSVPTLKIIGAFIRKHPAFRSQMEASMAACDSTSNKRLKTGSNCGVMKRSRRDPAGLLRKRKHCKKSNSKSNEPVDPSRALEKQFFLHIDGSTSGSRRMEILDAFSSKTSQVQILLVSTRAGAEGINLHAANRLVLFDVSWNPSNDHQSMCRSHRIGQSKPVHVYRLVSDGTMERKIYEQQVMKVGLSSSVLDASLQTQSTSKDSPRDDDTDDEVGTRFNTKDVMKGFLDEPPQTLHQFQPANCPKQTQRLIQEDPVLAASLAKAKDWIVEVLPVVEPTTAE